MPENASVEERLERGEILFYPIAPFALPNGEDQSFLLQQQVAGLGRKNITYNPHNGETTGFARIDAAQADRLGNLLAEFSRTVTSWLTDALPRYRDGLERDRATFRPEEEAIRRLRLNAQTICCTSMPFPTARPGVAVFSASMPISTPAIRVSGPPRSRCSNSSRNTANASSASAQAGFNRWWWVCADLILPPRESAPPPIPTCFGCTIT